MPPLSVSSSAPPPDATLWEQLSAFGQLWPYLWRSGIPGYRLRVIAAIVLTTAGQFVLVGAPFFLGRAIDAVDAAQGDGSVWASVGIGIVFLIAGYAGLRVLSVLIGEGREYLFAPVGQNAQRQVATATFAHLHKLSLRYHLERRTGGLSRVIERGIRSIDFLFRFLLFNIGPTLLQLSIAAGALWLAFGFWFALVATVTVIGYFVFTIRTTEWRLAFRRQMNRLDQEANAKAIDSLLNYETVKYFNAEGFETARYDGAMAGYQKAAVKSRTSLATVNIGQALLTNIGLLVQMWLAAVLILGDQLSVGAMTTITLVMAQLYRPLNILGFAYREIKQALTDMDKMFKLLEIEPEVRDAPGAQDIGRLRGRIDFEDVRFSYEPDREILNGISFSAEPGQRVGIVGPTGAGKSTISRILFRFYDISSGCVRIDGHDIAGLSQDSLRARIGIVPQDTVLFNDTIGYNIGYAKPGASQAEIEDAARSAAIHDFITSLPKGYDTMVGERGLKLSGGEKQRVAIARTLLKDPEILILDEATSALDNATEAEIQSALDVAARDRTTLVIAHRLTTVRDADVIIVMENGRIVERGTHDELISSRGLYASLWTQQVTEAA